jgi:hypothetical protein
MLAPEVKPLPQAKQGPSRKSERSAQKLQTGSSYLARTLIDGLISL